MSCSINVRGRQANDALCIRGKWHYTDASFDLLRSNLDFSDLVSLIDDQVH